MPVETIILTIKPYTQKLARQMESTILIKSAGITAQGQALTKRSIASAIHDFHNGSGI